MLNILFKRLGIESFRTKNIIRHAGASFFYKAGSVLASFLIVPLTIDYLDNENYGIWLTLTSFISWFSFFDIGLGHGLRNKFAESKALGKYDRAQLYVSTAYFTIAAISLIVCLLFVIASAFIDWTTIFNTSENLRKDLEILVPVLMIFFGMQLIAKLIITIYIADQYHSIDKKISFISHAVSLLIIWLLTRTDHSSLLLFGIIFSALPVIILAGLNMYAFRYSYKEFRPKLKYWKKKYFNDIAGLGIKFFILQINVIILFSTDNLIISHLFEPDEVVPYQLSRKYFTILTMIYGIMITPFWSSFTEAFAKKDYTWIRKSVSTIQKLWLLIPFALVIMILLSNWFFDMWLGDRVSIPLGLSLGMALFVAMSTFNHIYTMFVNGVGKIQLPLIEATVSIIINVPVSILFASYFNLGPAGVILATCFCLSYGLILRPMHYYKVINNRATGIWNK